VAAKVKALCADSIVKGTLRLLSAPDRENVPQISLRDMFDDAFTAIARDGAGAIEAAGRLQMAFHLEVI